MIQSLQSLEYLERSKLVPVFLHITNTEELGKGVRYSMDNLRVVKGCSMMGFLQVGFKVVLNTIQCIFNFFLAGA